MASTAQVVGYFFASFCLGWCVSYAILSFKRLSEVSTS